MGAEVRAESPPALAEAVTALLTGAKKVRCRSPWSPCTSARGTRPPSPLKALSPSSAREGYIPVVMGRECRPAGDAIATPS